MNALSSAYQSLSVISTIFNSHPFSLTSLCTAAFTGASITSLVLESNRSCNPDLQLWLGVMTAYGIVRWTLRAFIEAVNLEYISYSGNITLFYKLIEMVDIFGMVWFSVGNLLVFNGTKCAQPDSTPMTFWVCLVHIIVGYFSLILPMIVRVCVSRTANGGVVVTPESAAEVMNESPASVQERNEIWRRWLSGYSCNTRTYREVKSDEVEQISVSGDGVGVEGKNHGDLKQVLNSCPICLLDFEDSSEVVNYPCSTRIHFFHTTCMFDWLKVSSRRGLDCVTCPCCREVPIMPGAPSRRTFSSRQHFFEALPMEPQPPHFLRQHSSSLATVHPSPPMPYSSVLVMHNNDVNIADDSPRNNDDR